MGGAGGAVGGHLGLVHQHVIPLGPDVFNVVGGKHTLGAHSYRGAGESAGFQGQGGVGGGNPAVPGGAHFNLHPSAGGGAGALKHIGAGHQHLHRLTGLFRQQGGHRLQVHGNLAAKAAANFHRHHFDLGNRQIQNLGQGVPGAESSLGAGPDRQLAVGVPQGRRVLRLNVALVHRGGIKLRSTTTSASPKPRSTSPNS